MGENGKISRDQFAKEPKCLTKDFGLGPIGTGKLLKRSN